MISMKAKNVRYPTAPPIAVSLHFCATALLVHAGAISSAGMTTSSSLPMESDGVVGFESSNPAMDGAGETGGEHGGPSTPSRGRKRARGPQDEEPAPAAKRTVKHQGADCDVEHGLGSGEAMGTPPGSFSSPLQQFLLDFSSEVSGNGGGGDDSALPLPLPLPLLLPPPDGEFSWTPHESFQGPVGGLKASSCWDGGCGSRSPPGSGGGFEALPAASLSPLFSPRGTADEVGDLGLPILDPDMAKCMATLQATHTVSCGRGIVTRIFQGCSK